MKLALLTEIPAPFRVPLFNALAERLELRVLFLAARDPRRPHYRAHFDEMRFDYRVLDGSEIHRDGRWVVFNRRARRELRSFDPDAVVIGGWNQPAMWAARTVRRPALIWVESTLYDARRGLAAIETVKRLFLRTAAGVLVAGTASAAYARALGVPEAKIHVAPNAVDATIFGVDRRPHEGCVVLYVGRLDREKGVDDLIRAVADVRCELLVVGTGTDAGRLRTLARDRRANVAFLGALDRDELPDVYAGADVLVLPSRSEPWGMVLNEGAAAGLALVGSDAVGAAHDLIDDGRNGFRVPTGDVGALREALAALADDPQLRNQFGAHSRAIARRFTADAWADGVVEGLKAAAIPSSR